MIHFVVLVVTLLPFTSATYCSAYSEPGHVCGDTETSGYGWMNWSAKKQGTSSDSCKAFCEQQGSGCCEWREDGWCFYKENGIERYSPRPYADARVSMCFTRRHQDPCPDGYEEANMNGLTCSNSKRIHFACRASVNPCSMEECGERCSLNKNCKFFWSTDNNVCQLYHNCDNTRTPLFEGNTCAKNPCAGVDTVRVEHIDHAWQSTNGRYFYFSKDEWTTMAGSWEDGQKFRIDQWRDSKLIEENLEVIIWDNFNGVHGRYNPYVSAMNDDWQPNDIISLSGACGRDY